MAIYSVLCEKRHIAAVVIDNKYFITLVSKLIAITEFVGCIFPHLHFMKISCPLMQ